MIYFKVHSTENIEIKHSNGTITHLKSSNESNDNEYIYTTIYSHYCSLKNKYSKEIIRKVSIEDLHKYILPEIVGHEDHDKFNPIEKQIKTKLNHKIKIGITTNGSQIGDSIIILSALNQFNQYLSNLKIDTEITFLKPHFGNLENLFALSLIPIKNIRLPITIEQLNQFDYLIDLDSQSGVMNRKIMNSESMIDCFLDAMSLNYKNIPDSSKNIQLNKPQDNDQLKNNFLMAVDGQSCILFHPKSSVSLRSIPEDYIDDTINNLCHSIPNGYKLITVCKGINNDNIINLSHLSTNLIDFFHLISYSKALITVDTAAYHIANLYNIPTILLSAGNPGRRQSKYYKNLTLINIAPQLPLNTKILKLHKGGTKDEILDLWRGICHPVYSKWAMNSLKSYLKPISKNNIQIENIYSVKSDKARIINRQNTFINSDEIMLIIKWKTHQVNDYHIIASWYDPNNFCVQSTPFHINQTTKYSYIIYLGPKQMVKGKWTINIKTGNQVIATYYFYIQSLPDHLSEKPNLQNINPPKIFHTIEGTIVKGTGEASAHTIKKQLPYFIKRIPELANYYIGTINVQTPKEIYFTNFSFLFKDIEWNPGFKECFGFIQILIEIKNKQFPGYIYIPFRSPHMQNLFQLEIICPKIDLSLNPSLKIHFLKPLILKNQVFIF